jgi:hypothetical protein
MVFARHSDGVLRSRGERNTWQHDHRIAGTPDCRMTGSLDRWIAGSLDRQMTGSLND